MEKIWNLVTENEKRGQEDNNTKNEKEFIKEDPYHDGKMITVNKIDKKEIRKTDQKENKNAYQPVVIFIIICHLDDEKKIPFDFYPNKENIFPFHIKTKEQEPENNEDVYVMIILFDSNQILFFLSKRFDSRNAYNKNK